MPSDLEKKLISRLKNDDVKAFDGLYNIYSKRLYRFSFSILKNKEDAEEIVQEVFMKVWEKRKEIDSSKSFKSYLFTISYNHIITLLRTRLKEKAYLDQLEKQFIFDNGSSQDETDYNIMKSRIDRAVQELPKKRRQIYILSREKGLTHKEISEQLNISVKTVENQINLALRHLKKQLGDELLALLLFLALFV